MPTESASMLISRGNTNISNMDFTMSGSTANEHGTGCGSMAVTISQIDNLDGIYHSDLDTLLA